MYVRITTPEGDVKFVPCAAAACARNTRGVIVASAPSWPRNHSVTKAKPKNKIAKCASCTPVPSTRFVPNPIFRDGGDDDDVCACANVDIDADVDVFVSVNDSIGAEIHAPTIDRSNHARARA
jgi:hypothetical protein